MSNEIQKISKPAPPAGKPSAIQLMAARLHVDPIKLTESLRETVFKKATNEEMLALVVVSNEYGLNPFLREIFAFPAKGGGIVPVVSVDGWNKMLVNNDQFDGITYERIDDEQGNLFGCKATVYVKNRAHPCVIVEYLSECKRNTEPWNNMPWRMLRNRTTCQAGRMAFGFSGVYHEEEAPIDITATIESLPSEAVTTPKQLPNTPPPKVVPPAEGKTPQDELETLMVSNGYTFGEFIEWAGREGHIADPTSVGGFDQLPTDVCRRMLRAQAGLLKAMAEQKSPQ